MLNREAEAIGHNTRIRDVTTLDTLVGDTLLREELLAGVGGVFAFAARVLPEADRSTPAHPRPGVHPSA
jgi:hypothetical protein